MRRIFFTALGAASIAFASPAAAQSVPLNPGDFWAVTGISIDDGHFATYADYLAGQWRRQQEFSRSKGWLKSYHVLSNNNRRDGEPDLYLVSVFDRVPTAAEDIARDKEFDAFLANSARQREAQSGARAKFRKVRSNMLLQEMLFAR